MYPFFSVIIPLYNKEDTLSQAIKSVLSQTYTDFELIVVNDGSTDGSMIQIDTIKDTRVTVLHQQNKGVAMARNVGIKKAKGKLIAFLDADDHWGKDHLLSLHELYLAFPEAGMYAMRYQKIYSETAKKKMAFTGLPKKFLGIVPDYFEACSADSLASASSVAIAAFVFDTVGYFDKSMPSGEDTDMWIRIALQYKIAFHDKTTVSYRFYIKNSLSKTAFDTNKMKLLIKYTNQEKKHPSLKKYLDLNRYTMAINCTLRGDQTFKKTILSNINYQHLNRKQRFLLKLPRFVLRQAKTLQLFLAKKRIFLSAFDL